jgi:outer membrane protein TolC
MGRAVVMLLLLGLVFGCVPSTQWDRLDADVARMIEQRQASSLGPQGESDPQVIPPATAATDGREIYETQPPTRNPPREALPARPAPQDASQAPDQALPIMLDELTDGLRMDLPALLGYAISYSPEYRSQKEDLFLQTLALIIERHLWGPRFFNTVTAQLDGVPESGDFDQAFSLVNEFSVTQRLPYGGQIAATALVDYVNFLRENSAFTGEDETQSAAASLSLDLPLLRGAGLTAREVLIQAERNLIYAVRDFERFRREFLVEISRTYFDLVRQQRQIENLKLQVENLERLADRFEALAEAGRQPYFEAERAVQQVLFGRSNLLNSEESYAASLDSFKIRIGMATTQPLLVIPADVRVPQPVLDASRAVETAWSDRLDLQTTRDRVDDARRQVEVARNLLLPGLDLFADISAGTDADKRLAGVDIDPSTGRYSTGIVFDAPLDRRIEQAQYRQSLIDLERASRNYTVARDRVALEVRQSVRQIEQARFTLQLQQRNVALAERRAMAVQLRERELGPRDVIEAQEDLLDARDRRDAAIAELQRSILQFLLDTDQMRVSAEGKWLPPGELIVDEPATPTAAPDQTMPLPGGDISEPARGEDVSEPPQP